MARRNVNGVWVNFPDTMSAAQIAAESAKIAGSPVIPPRPDTVSRGAPSDQTAAGVRAKGPTEPLAKWGLDALPTAGGLVGGTIGGIGGTIGGLGVGGVPGAVGGATMGGMGGEALRQLGLRAMGLAAPETPQEALGGIGREGVAQGVSELAGRGVAGAVGAAASPLMRRAIRPTATMLEEFPNIVETALRERLPVGKLPWEKKAGSELAAEARRASAKETASILRRGDLAGLKFQGRYVMPELHALWAEIKQQPLSSADMRAVDRMVEEFVVGKSGPMTATEFNQLKRIAQKQAGKIYAAERKGAVLTAGQDAKARFHDAVASGTQRNLEEGLLPRNGRNRIGESNAKTRDLIGAGKAIKRAELRNDSPVSSLVIPGALASGAAFVPTGHPAENALLTFLLAHGASNPEALSRAALLSSDPRFLFALGQLPRAGNTLLPRPDYGAAPDTTR